VYIPKGTKGETRPIGITSFEDKVLQRAVQMVLEPLDGGIFVCELIPEIDDPSSVRDGLEARWRRPRKCRNGLSYDDKLPLYRRSNQPRRRVP
jgi:hypothetical protein